MAKWWEIEQALEDAKQNVDYARRGVSDMLPEDCDDPALNDFIQRLDTVLVSLRSVITEPIRKAIDFEEASDYEAECRADAMSY